MHARGGRRIRPEILDTLAAEEARASLRDLTRINRRWGGYSTLRRLMAEVAAPEETFSLLDVGAASGDMGEKIQRWYPGARVISLDRIPSHLPARGARVAGDAFLLPFGAKSFDFVFCSLFLHHFPDEAIVQLLREFWRVARRSVLAIDLARHPVAYYFLPWTRWIFRWNWVTVHDGPISVEAAFRPAELEELARRAGLGEARARGYYPAFRIALWARPEQGSGAGNPEL
jgi:2-polyprenyl-3-methyl-5-hydroxy-6-metoxy-1,4-benzoquinol methylase